MGGALPRSCGGEGGLKTYLSGLVKMWVFHPARHPSRKLPLVALQRFCPWALDSWVLVPYDEWPCGHQ